MSKYISLPSLFSTNLSDGYVPYLNTNVLSDTGLYWDEGNTRLDVIGQLRVSYTKDTNFTNFTQDLFGQLSVNNAAGVVKFYKTGATTDIKLDLSSLSIQLRNSNIAYFYLFYATSGGIGFVGTSTNDTIQRADFGNMWIGTNSSKSLYLVTGGTSKMEINSSGAITVSTSLGGAGSNYVPMAPIANQQSLTGAGAATVTEYLTAWTSNGDDQVITLADGAVIGQLKKVKYVAEGAGTEEGRVTPSNYSRGSAAYVNLVSVGDYVIFQWDGSNWVDIELGTSADSGTIPTVTVPV